jgi:hypothetical protein
VVKKGTFSFIKIDFVTGKGTGESSVTIIPVIKEHANDWGRTSLLQVLSNLTIRITINYERREIVSPASQWDNPMSRPEGPC